MNRHAALSAIAATAVAPALRARASAADETVLHLGTPPTDASGQYYYADAEGFFKKAGLPAEISTLPNGEAVTAGVVGGSINIGNGQVISVITAYAKGLPLTIVAGSGINTARTGLGASGAFFVPKNSTAATGKDFIGKTVGVQGLKGFAQYGTSAWLDRTGGDSSSVHFVELSSAVMGTALAEGRLDGAFIPEPNVSNVAKLAKKIATPMDTIAPSFYSGAHFTTLAWAKANVDLAHRFEKVMYETAAWANKNQDKSADILAAAMRLDPEVVHNSNRIQYSTRRDPSLLQPMINLTAKYAGITAFPAEDLFFKG